MLPSTLPPVSVIMAAYNGEQFIEEAVESILNQTHHNLELIVVDDGSTDRTGEIIVRYAARDSRLRIVSQPNQDQPTSLNRALALAQHEWVAVIDHDDVSVPHRLETQLRAVIVNPAIRILGSAALEIGVTGQQIGRRDWGPRSAIELDQMRASNQVIGLVHPSILMHRPTVLALGGYDPAFGASADTELWSRVSDHHLVIALSDVLLYYRIHGQNMSFTRFFEQRFALRWLNARQVARRQNRRVPSRDEYLAIEQGWLGLGHVNQRRKDYRELLIRQARLRRDGGPARQSRFRRVTIFFLAPRQSLWQAWRKINNHQ